jgi:hypothetical protein
MPRDDSASRFTRHRPSLPSGWLLTIGCVWLAGCGVQAYEERLKNANELFTYQNKLDQVLAKSPWVAPNDLGISMRTPLGYALIPPPAPVAEGDESAEPPVDPRQPTYLGVPEIEGLIGAWKATVPTNQGANAAVFLYVVGNHQRLLNSRPGEQGLPVAEYLQDLESLLQLQLGITITPGGQAGNQINVKIPESIPRVEQFVRKKEFEFARLVPTEDALQQLGIDKSAAFEAYLYEHKAGSIQVAILLVAPQSVSNPDAALRVALETLNVSDKAPRRATPGQPGAGPGKSAF